MRLHAITLLVLAMLLGSAPAARATDGESSDRANSPRPSLTECASDRCQALVAAIDRAIEEKLKEEKISPAPGIGDAEYLRRVMLDLAGRVPTAKETREFLASEDAHKRQRLVDRLLASPDFYFHQRNELDILLLARLQWNGPWREYLLAAVREHRPWDQLVREILLPEKHRPDDLGAAAFLKQRAKDLDAMTNDTATLLFGVNISCAKCHDHPLVPDWHQEHYFGFASFFKRTFATRRGFLAERFEGELKYTTVSGEERRSNFMFLNGKVVEEPPAERSEQEWKEIREQLKKAEQDDKADSPPRPTFSPREALVSIALESQDRPMLARNLANRLWARLMGRGLVSPLDQMHSGNPPSHPELLDRLTSDLIADGYDARGLVRAIVLSRAYARSPHIAAGDETLARELFAVAVPRAQTPLQYSLSLWIASRNPESLPGLEKDEAWAKQRAQWETRSEGLARRFEIPDENYQVSVEEALLLSNSAQAQNDLLADQSRTLVGYLKSLGDRQRMIEEAYVAILARSPSQSEREAFAKYLDARQDRSDAAVQQLVWALLTSAEFRFNH